ncbi:translation initiation factor IF-2 [Actinomadura verrucosospora]|uniref:Translation initiation factor IF-2 n=1 Tax=Actinomadura verrucosospora TaxID=46165 RepID=A0A7D3ZNM5_ACTVE|nr:translation initiation factor IF-2 [Actinomadura verrucosospora]
MAGSGGGRRGRGFGRAWRGAIRSRAVRGPLAGVPRRPWRSGLSSARRAPNNPDTAGNRYEGTRPTLEIRPGGAAGISDDASRDRHNERRNVIGQGHSWDDRSGRPEAPFRMPPPPGGRTAARRGHGEPGPRCAPGVRGDGPRPAGGRGAPNAGVGCSGAVRCTN